MKAICRLAIVDPNDANTVYIALDTGVYVTTAVGTYAFLRQQSLRPFSSGFAAASFAFAGSMSAQMVHIGIVQGASWIPWMLLVEQRLAGQLLDSEPGARYTAGRSAARNPPYQTQAQN